MKENEIVEQLLKAKEAYYNDEPIMSDEQFDQLEDDLRFMNSENVYFSIVGTNIKGSNKVKHSVPMLSCAKSKTVEEVYNWLKKIKSQNEHLVIMPKVDGLSASIKYVNGNISYISTRGDGNIGQDITHLKDYLNIPLTVGTESIEVRGEIYLPKNTELQTNGKPLRNIAVGLVNRKTDREDAKHLKFIAYYLDKDSDSFVNDLGQLCDLNFEIVNCFITDSNKELEDYFNSYINELRTSWNFETDGLVVQLNNKRLYNSIDSLYTVDHHHYYNIALKPPAQGKETVLRGIDWDVSKQGNLIPVAQFDPIILGSSTVSRATLNNFENVEKNKLCIGDTIKIELANEVIPFFNKVVKSTSNKSNLIPTECPSCKELLSRNGVHLQCINSNCPEKNRKMITSYCQACEMDGVSESTIATLYDEGLIDSIVDLYYLFSKRKLLLNLDGFGETKVNNLLDQIEKSKKQTIVELLSKLSISSVGKRAIENLGIKTQEDFFNLKSSSKVVGQSLIDYRDYNLGFIKRLIDIIQPTDIVEKVTKGKVAMTGSGPKGRKELIKDLEAMGYEFTDSINKECTILLCENANSGSSKLEKAKKIGIKVINYSEFFN